MSYYSFLEHEPNQHHAGRWICFFWFLLGLGLRRESIGQGVERVAGGVALRGAW